MYYMLTHPGLLTSQIDTAPKTFVAIAWGDAVVCLPVRLALLQNPELEVAVNLLAKECSTGDKKVTTSVMIGTLLGRYLDREFSISTRESESVRSYGGESADELPRLLNIDVDFYARRERFRDHSRASHLESRLNLMLENGKVSSDEFNKWLFEYIKLTRKTEADYKNDFKERLQGKYLDEMKRIEEACGASE